MPDNPVSLKAITKVPRWVSMRNSLRFANNPVQVINENLEKYGSTYSFHLGGLFPGIQTIEPELIQHVFQRNHRIWRKSYIQTKQLAHFLGNGLLTSEGDYWLRQRRLIQPGFHKARLAALTNIMSNEIDLFLEQRFDSLVRQDAEVDVAPLMMEMALRIVGKSLFSTDIPDDELEIIGKNVTQIQHFMMRNLRQPYLGFWFAWSGEKRRHERMAAQSNGFLLKYINARRQSGQAYDDLLQMLLDARYEDTGQGMTDKQLLEESLILMVAGHETTANALTWTLYLLAQHPEVAEKMRQEAAAVLQGRTPGFEDLPKLGYTLQVIKESMRLYPPAWITDRIAVTDDEFQGMVLPKGSRIVAYIMGVHRNPEYWDHPDAFQPERFAPGREQHSFAYLPFGGGPRLCIGNNFALMEMQLVLVNVLQRYRFEVLPDFPVEMEPLITLRPKHGMRLKIHQP
ncbi:MAG TPA: cytochrome P450 [Saprospiraceae bacterium]|nr:cytochrome P450 [Saprospiraceae bacterium]HMQ81761.1 cytochrome P450 [Saprospiraceae bacterium]